MASVSDLRKCKRERRRVEDSRPRTLAGQPYRLNKKEFMVLPDVSD